MLAMTAAGLLCAPMLLAGATLADLGRGRRRLPTARTALFLLQYGINDSAEILLAPVLWAAAGFGTRLDRPSARRRYERLQAWSVELLGRRAEQLLGVRIEIDAAGLAALDPGPTIVLCRHVSLLDASLPTLVHQRRGRRSRGVLMAELLADPGFDLIYPHTGSVFIPRDDGPQSRSLLGRLVDGLEADTAVVIFPEGRLFRPERLARALDRLGETSPSRAERLGPLRHLLPPRTGGVQVLLDLVPGADVVVMAHVGLDQFASFRELARAVPLADPLRVTAWRVPRADIPEGADERVAWLDECWLRVDAWVDRVMA